MLGNHTLHDRVQVLQPRGAAERLAAYIGIARYCVVAEFNRVGEAVQPVRKAELASHHFTVLVSASKLGMHTRVGAKAVHKLPGVQLQ